MDLSYDLVASKCAEQMAEYQRCVLENQASDWSTICRPQGRALAACADASVPHLVELKNACAPQIATYRACLDRHASQDDAVIEGKCGGLMKEVWKCSERVMGDIERGHGAGARGGDGERLV